MWYKIKESSLFINFWNTYISSWQPKRSDLCKWLFLLLALHSRNVHIWIIDDLLVRCCLRFKQLDSFVFLDCKYMTIEIQVLTKNNSEGFYYCLCLETPSKCKLPLYHCQNQSLRTPPVAASALFDKSLMTLEFLHQTTYFL